MAKYNYKFVIQYKYPGHKWADVCMYDKKIFNRSDVEYDLNQYQLSGTKGEYKIILRKYNN